MLFGKETNAKTTTGPKGKRMRKGNLFIVYRRCDNCSNTKMFQTAMGQLKCTRCKHIELR
jgi:ribosomal protein S27E